MNSFPIGRGTCFTPSQTFKEECMKKLLIIPLLMLLCLLGCGNDNRWEIRQTVNPEVLNQLADKIAIKYNFGPFLILDDITLKSEAQALYIFKTKDVFELDVVVKYSDNWASGNNGFYYYFNESKINGVYGSKPICLSKLQAAEFEMDGFKWLEKKDGSIEDSVEPQENESVEKKVSELKSETTL
jgi:hypothetical protein